MSQWTIGIDVGGTKIEAALIEDFKRITQRKRWATRPEKGAEAIQKEIIDAVKTLQKEAGVTLSGVGIGIAGQIEPRTGTVLFAPNLGWHNRPLQADLERALQVPVRVAGDVQTATLGEWKQGAGRHCDDVICLCVGTGIGGGIVANGQLLMGHRHTAGEFGHMTISLHGPKCSCGNHGCLEAMASGWAIALRAKEAIMIAPDEGKRLLELAKGSIKGITTQMVKEAAYRGDALSCRVMDEATEALIAGGVSIVNALGPQRLLLGGGVIQGDTDLIKKISDGILEKALEAACKGLEILPFQLGGDATLIGAACLHEK